MNPLEIVVVGALLSVVIIYQDILHKKWGCVLQQLTTVHVENCKICST